MTKTKTAVADASLSVSGSHLSLPCLMATNVDKTRVVAGVRRTDFVGFDRFSGRNQHHS